MTFKDYSIPFSSASGEWETPQELIDDLSSVFKWDLDVCASRPNVCQNYFDGSYMNDGLLMEWSGLCWMNPPYGREIKSWVSRAATTAMYSFKKTTIVGLLPARTDTAWFHEYVTKAHAIVYIKGRLKFGSRSYWIERHQHKIMNAPKFDRILKKIGGKLCSEECRQFAIKHWPKDAKIEQSKWLEADFLRRESAPFPSLFAVWGDHLTAEQYRKLASYGYATARKTFPFEL